MTLGNAEDVNILMHREAHFGGSFPLMLDYYRKGGKGVCEDFDIQRIEALAEEEIVSGKNLAALLLTAKDAEEIKRARDAYKGLRKLYTSNKGESDRPVLIADLILSEEEEPVKEIEAIVQEKGGIVPHLIALMQAEDFYNPLFPGYGKAYKLAAKCLGLIGDMRGLIALFQSLGRGDFFDDEVSLQALKEIGTPAKEFLLRILESTPITEDNEKAAISLLAFKEDQEVAEKCFHLLKKLDFKEEGYLATYLILAQESLKDPLLRQEFERFSQSLSLPKELKSDFQAILKGWGS